MQMKAVLKTKPEVGAELRLVERPEVTPGHLLVKVLATALCHSDFDVYNYAPSVAAQNLKMPWIMGHEFFGEIVQVGQGVEGFAVGDRISSDSHVPCGYCHTCITGNQHICDNTMTVLGRTHPGCFAEYINLPAVAAVKMPKETRPECGALMEPFGVAVHAIQQAEIAGKTLVITGLGTIGMMALASARFLGATASLQSVPVKKNSRWQRNWGRTSVSTAARRMLCRPCARRPMASAQTGSLR